MVTLIHEEEFVVLPLQSIPDGIGVTFLHLEDRKKRKIDIDRKELKQRKRERERKRERKGERERESVCERESV